MGKIKKKGTSGTVTSFMTRKAALKKLQVSLAAFRKLCILKGIFPREPRKKFKGTNKTYYLTKDIIFLSHDPLLTKFREYRILQKKIRKARGKQDSYTFRRLVKSKNEHRYTLDHLVKERYPTFVDALQDLDDPLCLICMFINMPQFMGIKSNRINNCNRLYREWQAYIIQTHSLRKVFVSIKGYYFQAEVQGNKITWLVPHQFPQELTDNVDYRVLSTFLEFYETLMGFVLFRLYTSIGLNYPPRLNKKSEALGGGLDALLLQVEAQEFHGIKSINLSKKAEENEVQKASEKRITSLNESELLQLDSRMEEEQGENKEEEMVEEFSKEEEDFIPPSKKTDVSSTLFKGCKFFLSREVPKDPLEFMIRSFGGEVTAEGPLASYPESDLSITHQIVDRDAQKHQYLSRSYVQPQWIFDSINEQRLLDCREYAPSSKLPPHLSPFVDDEMEGYIPKRREELNSLMQVAAEETKREEEAFSDQEETVETLEDKFTSELKAELEGKEAPKSSPSSSRKRKAQEMEEQKRLLAET